MDLDLTAEEREFRDEVRVSLTLFASLVVRDGRPDGVFQAAAAHVIATDAALRNAAANIQVHGGIGFTWEHDAHLYVTRANVLATVLGGRAAHLATLLAERPAQS